MCSSNVCVVVTCVVVAEKGCHCMCSSNVCVVVTCVVVAERDCRCMCSSNEGLFRCGE